MFENKTILITGGAGFIGSNLALYFQEHYPSAKVVVFDRFRDDQRFENGNLLSLGHFKNLEGFKGEIIGGDINYDLELLKDFKFDYIFHQAAISDTTASNQLKIVQTNINAFKGILKLAKESNAKVIYASSGSVYGNLPAPQQVGKEHPLNIYGFSKLAMDNLALTQDEVVAVGLRYFNVYGEREFFKGKTASMILQFGLQLLRGENPRLFEGSEKIKRDFIYVQDVIQANLLACKAKKSGVYNVGTGKARSFKEIVDILCQELNLSPVYEYIPNPYTKQYQYFTQADISSTIKELGYQPKYSLEEGIKATLPYIKKIFEEEF